MFKWLNQLDNARWLPPALYYFKENWHQPNLVLRFLKDLERLVVSFVIRKTPPYKRIDQYCELLKAIYEKQDLFESNSPLQLTSGDCHEVLRILNGNMYLMHYVCRYVLLRLDAKLSDGSASYEYQTISIEHVLPQRPSPNSDWLKYFPTKQAREKYVHRLGNLVLLSRGKNIEAENYDFDLKKEKYFSSKTGVTSFALTSQVLHCREWTPTVIEQRQNQLMEIIKQLWRL